MTIELYWLIWSIFLTSVLWVPYIINRLREHGPLTAIWDPDGETWTEAPWAKRLMSAHVNAVENLVIFAPLIIIVHVLGVSTEVTQFAAMLYFFSRLAHAILFTLRIPVLRIVSFAGGVTAQMLLIFTLFGWIN